MAFAAHCSNASAGYSLFHSRRVSDDTAGFHGKTAVAPERQRVWVKYGAGSQVQRDQALASGKLTDAEVADPSAVAGIEQL